MSDQVKLAEETTSNLIYSSSVLKSTESEFASMTTHITVSSFILVCVRNSGGKLISKYGRRECTDRILLTIALILYFAVILYILRKRVFSIVF
uniref:7TM_GPCR_Srx domain-containing protein n=1 Tax=Syphacia muris TaxID=451379 RepID=A0A0N5AJ50_9BILA